MVDLHLSKSQYNSMCVSAAERSCQLYLYPPYNKVTKAKAACVPPPTITVLHDQAEVRLQALLDHTATRLLQLQEPVLENQMDKRSVQLTLHCKW